MKHKEFLYKEAEQIYVNTPLSLMPQRERSAFRAGVHCALMPVESFSRWIDAQKNAAVKDITRSEYVRGKYEAFEQVTRILEQLGIK